MWPFRKKNEDLIQILYYVTYKEICPVCKVEIVEVEHIYKLPVTSRMLMECKACHVAVYGCEKNIQKIKKTYERRDESLTGLALIKEEEIH